MASVPGSKAQIRTPLIGNLVCVLCVYMLLISFGGAAKYDLQCVQPQTMNFLADFALQTAGDPELGHAQVTELSEDVAPPRLLTANPVVWELRHRVHQLRRAL